MPRTKQPAAPPEPNQLVRKAPGTYRSGDDRFEVRQSGLGWFLVDSTQTDELGQELVSGPYPTLDAVRDAIPEARRTTVRALPKPKRPRTTSQKPERPAIERKPEPEPGPEPIDPLLAILLDAARAQFPPADLAVDLLEPARDARADAVVAFSGHSLVVAAVDPARIRRQLRSDDPGAPMAPTFLAWLGRQLHSEPGMIDAVLVARPVWVSPKALTLEPIRVASDEHERVQRARAHRSEVEVHTDANGRGLVIIGRGLAGRWEVSIEVHPEHRGRGLGADLARAALKLVPEGEPLFAQVSPGNAASLRAFLAAGYRPIGSEVLFLRG